MPAPPASALAHSILEMLARRTLRAGMAATRARVNDCFFSTGGVYLATRVELTCDNRLWPSRCARGACVPGNPAGADTVRDRPQSCHGARLTQRRESLLPPGHHRNVQR